jgi:hypothetical protein
VAGDGETREHDRTLVVGLRSKTRKGERKGFLFSKLLTVYFGAPSMFITLWFGFDYGTNPPLGTLII